MKIPGAVILLLALLMQTFIKGLILVSYNINQTYIASTLCENKATPQLHCNGKCVLVKQMTKESKESGSIFKKSFSEVLFVTALPQSFSTLTKQKTSQRFYQQRLPRCPYRTSVFHPPGGQITV